MPPAAFPDVPSAPRPLPWGLWVLVHSPPPTAPRPRTGQAPHTSKEESAGAPGGVFGHKKHTFLTDPSHGTCWLHWACRGPGTARPECPRPLESGCPSGPSACLRADTKGGPWGQASSPSVLPSLRWTCGPPEAGAGGEGAGGRITAPPSLAPSWMGFPDGAGTSWNCGSQGRSGKEFISDSPTYLCRGRRGAWLGLGEGTQEPLGGR